MEKKKDAKALKPSISSEEIDALTSAGMNEAIAEEEELTKEYETARRNVLQAGGTWTSMGGGVEKGWPPKKIGPAGGA